MELRCIEVQRPFRRIKRMRFDPRNDIRVINRRNCLSFNKLI